MDEKIVEWAEKFESILANHMPDAVQYGLLYIRMDALYHIVNGIIAIIIVFFLAKMINKITFNCFSREYQFSMDDPKDQKSRDSIVKDKYTFLSGLGATFDEENASECIPIIFGAVGIVICTIAALDQINFWNVIAIFNPKLGLIHQLLLK